MLRRQSKNNKTDRDKETDNVTCPTRIISSISNHHSAIFFEWEWIHSDEDGLKNDSFGMKTFGLTTAFLWLTIALKNTDDFSFKYHGIFIVWIPQSYETLTSTVYYHITMLTVRYYDLYYDTIIQPLMLDAMLVCALFSALYIRLFCIMESIDSAAESQQKINEECQQARERKDGKKKQRSREWRKEVPISGF